MLYSYVTDYTLLCGWIYRHVKIIAMYYRGNISSWFYSNSEASEQMTVCMYVSITVSRPENANTKYANYKQAFI